MRRAVGPLVRLAIGGVPGGLTHGLDARFAPPAREGWSDVADAARSHRPGSLVARRRRDRVSVVADLRLGAMVAAAGAGVNSGADQQQRRPMKTDATSPPVTTTPTSRGHQASAMTAPTDVAGPAMHQAPAT